MVFARGSFDPNLEAYMFGKQTYVGIVMMATATLVSSQGDQTQGPDFRTGGATKALSSAMAASAHEGERSTPSQAEILTDTRGFFALLGPNQEQYSQSLDAHDSVAGSHHVSDAR